MIASAPGHRPVTTHLFDDESRYLDSDVVFGVKSSLIQHFERHEPGEPQRHDGVGSEQLWYSLEHDFVLAPATR
jgi:hypothetical protein